jgi:hypothetical protein
MCVDDEDADNCAFEELSWILICKDYRLVLRLSGRLSV